MDIRRRVIGASAVIARDGTVTDVDLSGLIRKLLLFDKYILVSARLREFPILARYLGYGGLRDLLEAKLIEVRCECVQLAQMGQAEMFGDSRLPLFTYKFSSIDTPDKRQYVHECLQGLHGTPWLRQKEVIKLKKVIADAIRPLPIDLRSQLFPPFRDELLNNIRLVKRAVEMELFRRLYLVGVPFELMIHQAGEDIFKVETNLSRRAGISEADAHRIVERALLAVSGLVQSIGDMGFYSALSGYRDDELPLFRYKLQFLAEATSTQVRESDFQRVMEIAGLPEFPTGRIDVEKLLKVRESSEAREFRDWLGSTSQTDENEVRERVEGLRATLGLAVGGKTGKIMRFLLTNAIGLIPGFQVQSVILNAIDSFLVEKLLPRSGITAFVHELYPSIFGNDEGSRPSKTRTATSSSV